MCFFTFGCVLYDLPSLSYFDLILTLYHKIKSQTKSFFMQIEISQFQQFKYPIVYVVKVAISYNCFPTIMQHFVVKNAFISRHQMAQLVFRVPPIGTDHRDSYSLVLCANIFAMAWA